MKVLQLNTTVNTGSTGRIAEGIGQVLQRFGHDSYIAYSRLGTVESESNLLKIGNKLDVYLHGLKSRVLDRHGFGSKNPTKALVNQIEKINPDVIALHNLHGYYLNIEVLFNYLKHVQKPVIWTFHDCWPFTGHCSFFDYVSCDRWKTECYDCPLSDKYPTSWFMDNSTKNFHDKRELFSGLQNLTIVTPSQWLKNLIGHSFLSDYPVEVIHNGIDTKQFEPTDNNEIELQYGLKGKKIILGIASIWDRRKGINFFFELANRLDKTYRIILIGLSDKKIKELPDNIIGINRTENIKELVSFYTRADVFVNPTLVDNFPTTNLEALACGTPVVTFNTGGSPEAIDDETGIVVPKGDIDALYQAVLNITRNQKRWYTEKCRKRALRYYDKEERFKDYLNLYESALQTPCLENND